MNKCIVKIFEQPQEYMNILERMQKFTQTRNKDTIDQIWLLQHHPVFTFGAHTKPKMPPASLQIPVVPTDRGGNITYHAPGQIVVYTLLDTRRMNYSIHGLVEKLELLSIKTLEQHQIKATLIKNRRGVYVNNKKIASLGLRFKKYCSYHGLALNVNLDLKPFCFIDPCGYKQETTSMLECNTSNSCTNVQNTIIKNIAECLELDIIKEII